MCGYLKKLLVNVHLKVFTTILFQFLVEDLEKFELKFPNSLFPKNSQEYKIVVATWEVKI